MGSLESALAPRHAVHVVMVVVGLLELQVVVLAMLVYVMVVVATSLVARRLVKAAQGSAEYVVAEVAVRTALVARLMAMVAAVAAAMAALEQQATEAAGAACGADPTWLGVAHVAALVPGPAVAAAWVIDVRVKLLPSVLLQGKETLAPHGTCPPGVPARPPLSYRLAALSAVVDSWGPWTPLGLQTRRQRQPHPRNPLPRVDCQPQTTGRTSPAGHPPSAQAPRPHHPLHHPLRLQRCARYLPPHPNHHPNRQ